MYVDTNIDLYKCNYVATGSWINIYRGGKATVQIHQMHYLFVDVGVSANCKNNIHGKFYQFKTTIENHET